jgi:flagellar biosynthesis GTPase FlhF
MQVKVFEAADMASGLRMIRRELGPDALILSTRTIKGGKMGVLGKKTLEITAAVDNQWPEKQQDSTAFSGQSLAHKAYTDNKHFDRKPSKTNAQVQTHPQPKPCAHLPIQLNQFYKTTLLSVRNLTN